MFFLTKCECRVNMFQLSNRNVVFKCFSSSDKGNLLCQGVYSVWKIMYNATADHHGKFNTVSLLYDMSYCDQRIYLVYDVY